MTSTPTTSSRLPGKRTPKTNHLLDSLFGAEDSPVLPKPAKPTWWGAEDSPVLPKPRRKVDRFDEQVLGGACRELEEEQEEQEEQEERE